MHKKPPDKWHLSNKITKKQRKIRLQYSMKNV